MEIVRYLRLLRRHWLLILLCVVLSGGAALLVTYQATPRYQASITMFVSGASRDVNADSAYTASLLSQERVESYANLLSSERLASRLADTLGLNRSVNDLRDSIKASVVPDTVLLSASVADPSPAQARLLADTLGAEFVDMIDELERTARGTSPVKVTVVDRAQLPTDPVSPRPLANLALGLLAGLALGAGGAVLRETVDTTVKNVEQLADITSGPTLGVVARDDTVTRRPLILQGPAHGARAEAFRFLRTNLQFIDVDDPVRSAVITSAMPEEGKSLTACNLAIALALAGKRVVLVDGDLRKPSVARYLGLEGGAGLADLLVGLARLEDVLQQWGGLSLSVLPSGMVPPNPSELLASRQMRKVLDELRSRADIVLIDAPPLLPVSDAAVLAQHCDGAVLIARYARTTREHLGRVVEQLRRVDVRLLGSVLNVVPRSDRGGYGYSYGYRSERMGDAKVHEPVTVD